MAKKKSRKRSKSRAKSRRRQKSNPTKVIYKKSPPKIIYKYVDREKDVADVSDEDVEEVESELKLVEPPKPSDELKKPAVVEVSAPPPTPSLPTVTPPDMVWTKDTLKFLEIAGSNLKSKIDGFSTLEESKKPWIHSTFYVKDPKGEVMDSMTALVCPNPMNDSFDMIFLSSLGMNKFSNKVKSKPVNNITMPGIKVGEDKIIELFPRR